MPDPLVFLLVAARLAGLVLASPVFGHGVVPVRVRAGLVGVLALALAPGLAAPPLDAPPSWWALAAMVATEAGVGALLGVVVQLVVVGVELGGQVAGLQMGFGIAGTIDPGSETSAGLVAQWQQLAALLAFLVLDVHHALLRALVDGFRAAPIGTAVPSGALLASVVAQGASVFAIGVRIAAPVIVVLLVANGALGVLARVLPQANVLVVGLPVQVGVGLVVVGASLPFTVRFLADRFGELPAALHALIASVAAHG